MASRVSATNAGGGFAANHGETEKRRNGEHGAGTQRSRRRGHVQLAAAGLRPAPTSESRDRKHKRLATDQAFVFSISRSLEPRVARPAS